MLAACCAARCEHAVLTLGDAEDAAVESGLAPRQQTRAMAGDQHFEQYRRATKRDVFLHNMDMIMP
jgi:hypothetical protein